MKLFQIEEPEGAPPRSDEPGAAVGIELSLAAGAAVAVAVGGNAEILPGADGAARLPMATVRRGDGAWDSFALGRVLLALRVRAEKALARPVTHAVIAAAATADADRATLAAAAEAAGLRVLRVMDVAAAAALARGSADAAPLGAAIQAEDDAAALGAQGT
jgi:Ethanolamine utilization protein EutJ (predicted chaperonin)